MRDRVGLNRSSVVKLVVLGLAALAAGGCGNPFRIVDLIDGPEGRALTVSPSSGTVTASTSVELVASGGYPPYSYRLDSGGGSLLDNVYTAPDSSGNAEITVLDSVGASAQVDLEVVASGMGLTVSPQNPTTYPGGSLTFVAVGGTAPISWQINPVTTIGSTIVSDTGVYTAGEFAGSDTIVLTDAFGTVTTTVTVNPIPAPDAIDYVIDAVNYLPGGTLTGDQVDVTLDLRNATTGAGVSPIEWRLYASEGNETLLAGDADHLLASGTTLALGAGGTVNVPVTGNWPGAPASYYLVATIQAVDESNPAGNQRSNGSPIAVSSPPPVTVDVDYRVASAPAGGIYQPDSPAVESFTLENLGSAAGTADVSWVAYISTDSLLDAGDPVFANGSIAALGANPASIGVSVEGVWPAAGTFYLIVRAHSTDDIDLTNNGATSSVYTITDATPGVSDYTTTEITKNYATDRAGSLIRETFTVTNIGELAGPDFDWSVYVSPDAVLDVGTDTLVGSAAAVAGIGTGASLAGVAIDGLWPEVPGDYYLIADISPVDGEIANNTVAQGPYTIELPPDYSLVKTPPRLDAESEGGNIDELLSAVGIHEFTIDEMNGTDGSSPVSWSVYLSSDPELDASDTRVANGAIAAPPAFGALPVRVPDSVRLPSTLGYWHLIVTVSSGEDMNASNNTIVSDPIPVWTTEGDAVAKVGNYEIDTTEDDSAVGQADDFAILLNPGDAVQIGGLSDESGVRDSFRVTIGSGADGVGGDVNELWIRVTWNISGNDQDIFVFDTSTKPVGLGSRGTETLGEPTNTATPTTDPADWYVLTSAADGLIPGETYLVDILSFADTLDEVGDAYTVFIEAKP